MNLLIVFIAAAAGAVLGLFVPDAAEALCRLKYARKKKDLPADPRFASLTARLLCAAGVGAGCGVMAHLTGRPGALFLGALIWWVGAVVILVDLRVRLIANEAVLALAVAGGALQWDLRGFGGLLHAAVAMLVVMAGFIGLGSAMGLWKIGAGDVKLAGVMGLTLGTPTVMNGLLIMAVSLLFFCGAGLALKKITLKSMVAFGPFIIWGLLGGLLFLL